MTKSVVLNMLGREKQFLDFELFESAHAPGEHGGTAYERAYIGFDFVGYSRQRDAFLLVESWRAEIEDLYLAPVIQVGKPVKPERMQAC